MTEREKTDFNRGDTNNEHFFKRGLGSSVTEQAHKRLRTDNQPGLNKQTGRGEKRTCVTGNTGVNVVKNLKLYGVEMLRLTQTRE